ncbi:ankyrin repeat domain-containing protein [bacterium]|nr:ankyrin repeat domain-containing protein [bacterium]
MFRKFFLLVVLFLACSAFADDKTEEFWNAVRKGDVEKVKTFLAEGIDVNAKNRYGATALSFAADKGHVEIARLLIEKGADVNVKDTFYRATPLSWAIYNKHVEVAQLLLEKGATDVTDALGASIDSKDSAMVKLILEKGKLKPEELSDALEFAKQVQDQSIVDALKQAGAKEATQFAVPDEILQDYAGTFRNESGNEVTVGIQDKKVLLQSAGADPFPLSAVDNTTFKSGGFSITFFSKENKVAGFNVQRPDGSTTVYNRMEVKTASAEPPAEVPRVVSAPPVGSSSFSVKTGGNWPSFRGLNATGIADGENPPTAWDAGKSVNIRWKTEIPGLAHSSPVVWGNRVFVTTAISSNPDSKLKHGLYGDVAPDKDLSKHTWKVYCLDKQTGKILWQRLVAEGVPEVKRHPKSTQANSTPATDGKHLAVLLGNGELLVYNMQGDQLWKKDLGVLNSGWFYDPDYEWGYGSSPVLYKNLVIVQCDLHKNSFIGAFDVKSGKQIWLTPREEIPSWGSPTVHVGKDRAELITNGTGFIRGYDPLTGKELWKLAGNSEITVPTPFVAHDLIYVTSGYTPVQPIYAIKLGATGDISLKKDQESNQFVAWSKQRGGPYMPTPIVYGDYLYTCANNGVVTAYNAKTGERIYQQRLGGKGSSYAFTASPVAADGKLYFTSEDGEIFVVKAGPTYEVLSVNKMGEVILATPAISQKTFIVRTLNHVYGISE